jgi:hypothetical protein
LEVMRDKSKLTHRQDRPIKNTFEKFIVLH